MRIPLDWVREYVDFTTDTSDTAQALTMLGLEVEEVEDTGASGSAVLNITVMSNRGDCLSMIGVARELAAEEALPLKLPSFEMEAGGDPAESIATIEIADPDLCYRYAATIIQGVKVGPSPEWMANRLLAAGMRPINNIVDVTNYVMLETGQPLHAFDYDLLPDGAIVVRRARADEKVTTLDGVERALTTDMLAICDKSRPIAVAGVMGGLDTEVTEKTTNVLIESACFNASSVRATARSLGLPTEASYRFERGVDLGGTAKAAIRAAELIRQVGGGMVCQGVVDNIARQAEEKTVSVRPERAGKILGVNFTADDCAGYLRRLSLPSEIKNNLVEVTIPSYRQDITQEIDLIEEIGRVYGFNNLPTTLIDGVSLQGKDSSSGMLESEVRTLLLSLGLQEVMTHSIVARDTPAPEGVDRVNLRNVLSEDVAEMRAALIPGIVQVLGDNFSRDIRDLCIFETGQVFRADEKGLPTEAPNVAGCLMGSRWDGEWTFPDKKLTPDAFRKALSADFYQAKGIVEALLDHFGVEDVKFVPGSAAYWRKGYAADVVSGDKTLGQIGEVSHELRDKHDLNVPCYGFELSLQALAACGHKDRQWKTPSRFPAVKRDLAVVVKEETDYASVMETIRQVAVGMIEEITLFDVYRGAQIGEGRKSLGLSLVFRSVDKTLTDDEVSHVLSDIRSALSQKLEATFRDF